MKVDVPFFESKTNTDCGPLALKMVADFFGKQLSFEDISHAECQLESGMVWSVGILKAAREFGFTAVGISNSAFTEHDLEFYKQHIKKDDLKLLQKLLKENPFEERELTLDELLRYVSEESVPIVLLDWSIIREKEEFSGHFVPIVGYDEKFVYVHNPGLHDPTAFMPIKRDVFVKAWESKGTDKDVIVVSQ